MPRTNSQLYIDRLCEDLQRQDVKYEREPTGLAVTPDILIPDMQLGICIHDVRDASIDTNHDITRTHAQNKALAAKADGIGLIQLTDADVTNLRAKRFISARIAAEKNGRERIGARKCELTALNHIETATFLDTWHVQGALSRKGSSTALRQDGRTLACMLVGKSRYERQKLELLRYCTRPDISVIGGFDRLLDHVCQEYDDADELITFADLNMMMRAKTVYDKRFELLGTTAPDYRWIEPDTGHILSRYACMKHKLVKEGADPTMTEAEIMLSRGYLRVFGAGSLKYSRVI